MAKKLHPHDALIAKLEECRDDLEKLSNNHDVDEGECHDAYASIENAIDDVRQIDID